MWSYWVRCWLRLVIFYIRRVGSWLGENCWFCLFCRWFGFLSFRFSSMFGLRFGWIGLGLSCHRCRLLWLCIRRFMSRLSSHMLTCLCWLIRLGSGCLLLFLIERMIVGELGFFRMLFLMIAIVLPKGFHHRLCN
jgi:hypothetical protein